MKRYLQPIFLLLMISFVAGCANPPPNVDLPANFWQHPSPKITVVKAKKDATQLYQEGAEGILDMVINQAATNDFATYLKKTSDDWFKQLQANFVMRINKHHMTAVSNKTSIDLSHLENFEQDNKKYATLNLKPLAVKLDTKRLLIIEAKQVGAVRRYYGFIPLNAPKAVCNLMGRLVNLDTNAILWRYNANVIIPVKGEWDQSPKYHNFSVALRKAIHVASNELLDSFFADQQ